MSNLTIKIVHTLIEIIGKLDAFQIWDGEIWETVSSAKNECILDKSI